jgi:cephalosporin hydroxylase
MQLQLLFENDEKTTALFIAEEEALLVVRFSGAVEHETYKAALEKLYKAITVYKGRKIVYDLQDLTYTDMQSRAWYATNFLPRIIKNFGLVFRTAIIQSANEDENLSVEFLAKVGSNLGFRDSIRLFKSREEALLWLTAADKILSTGK